MFAARKPVAEKEVLTVLRASKLRPPARVLDLACGAGRHSIAFARRGFAVTGLDYSDDFLREARRAAAGEKLPVAFVHGDMRDLRAHFETKHFDLVVSLFNSFGYFAKRSDDQRVLKEVYRILRPGGAFVINTLHAGGVAARLRVPMERGSEPVPDVFMIDRARYDKVTKETNAEWIIIDARGAKTRVLRQRFRQNVYSHAELKTMLRAAGFRIEHAWGPLPGGRLLRDSWHQTILARRPAVKG
ncbi:class I SAM-dependent methyltransferase [Pseudorhodoplanes sp.]|uniref:class I SAM-dependent methyltransferase n=1 Tax=Pseudorhodoplanes sp. TaxID=1934341 RepID=UPI003D107EAE